MIGFIQMLWRTKYLGSLLALTNFIQVWHTNNSPNNSNFVVSKHGTYFVKCWAFVFMWQNVCDLMHNLSQATHSYIEDYFNLSLYLVTCFVSNFKWVCIYVVFWYFFFNKICLIVESTLLVVENITHIIIWN